MSPDSHHTALQELRETGHIVNLPAVLLENALKKRRMHFSPWKLTWVVEIWKQTGPLTRTASLSMGCTARLLTDRKPVCVCPVRQSRCEQWARPSHREGPAGHRVCVGSAHGACRGSHTIPQQHLPASAGAMTLTNHKRHFV